MCVCMFMRSCMHVCLYSWNSGCAMCMCVCMCACVHACMSVCMSACVCECVRAYTLGTLGDRSTQLLATIKAMKEKIIELLPLSESRWTGCGITKIRSTTTVHFGSPSYHVCGIAIVLGPHAHSSLEAANSGFHPIYEHIIHTCLKIHLL